MKEIIELKASGDIDRAAKLLYQLCEKEYADKFPLSVANQAKFKMACVKAIAENEDHAILLAAKGYLAFILEFPDLSL